jgi:hypothetical protein
MKRRRFLELATCAAAGAAIRPVAIDWYHSRFAAACSPVREPDETIEMLFENQWIINGRPTPDINDLKLRPGRRYRLRIMNATAWPCSVRLNRRFELTRVNQIPVSGIFRNTVRLEGYSTINADVAN